MKPAITFRPLPSLLASLLIAAVALPVAAEEAATASATFAGGCFWCMEPPFDVLDGVISTTSGYTGGREEDPTYEEVSAGRTGHAEAVEVVYDPSRIGYAELLEVFWRNVDPTTPDRQFCDRGRQYRTAIYYHDDQQRRLAEASRDRIAAAGLLDAPIVTEIVAAGEFYPAEDYHQDYYKKNPIRYKLYRRGCGRDRTLERIWGDAPAVPIGGPAKELLAAAIAYHDPQGLWATAAWRLSLEETRPGGGGRTTVLVFDEPRERFEWRRERDGTTSEGSLDAGECRLRLDGLPDFSVAERDEHRLTCERLEWWRDYYGYLWGLPMKLRDPSAVLWPEVRRGEFDGRPTLSLKVTYEEPVGSDTWYLYFDPASKALIGYRFYHDEAANDGEYILLSGETTADGLRLPRARSWYTHSDDEFLGTDTLVRLERLEAPTPRAELQ